VNVTEDGNGIYKSRFYQRDAMLALSAGLCDSNVSVRLSVRLSVCPSRAGIVSKRRKLAA